MPIANTSPQQNSAEKSVWENTPLNARAANVPSAASVWLTPKAVMAVLNEYRTFSKSWNPSPMKAPMKTPS